MFLSGVEDFVSLKLYSSSARKLISQASSRLGERGVNLLLVGIGEVTSVMIFLADLLACEDHLSVASIWFVISLLVAASV